MFNTIPIVWLFLEFSMFYLLQDDYIFVFIRVVIIYASGK